MNLTVGFPIVVGLEFQTKLSMPSGGEHEPGPVREQQ